MRVLLGFGGVAEAEIPLQDSKTNVHGKHLQSSLSSHATPRWVQTNDEGEHKPVAQFRECVDVCKEETSNGLAVYTMW